MKTVELNQVMKAVQSLNFHAKEALQNSGKEFIEYMSKKGPYTSEAFQEGYSYALRDVMIALNALVLPKAKGVGIAKVEADSFSITEEGVTSFVEILRNKDGTVWGVYANKPNSDSCTFQDGVRNILILASMGYLQIKDFPRQKQTTRDEKTK
jgi:hypothetical protein